MFTNDIALAGTSTTKTYKLQSIENKRSIRSDGAAVLGKPNTLVISHQEVKRTYGTADRHLVRLDHTIAGVSPAPDVVVSVQLVIESPRTTAVAADVKDVITRMVSFLAGTGYQDALLNNEP